MNSDERRRLNRDVDARARARHVLLLGCHGGVRPGERRRRRGRAALRVRPLGACASGARRAQQQGRLPVGVGERGELLGARRRRRRGGDDASRDGVPESLASCRPSE